jgi:hypothetical protein
MPLDRFFSRSGPAVVTGSIWDSGSSTSYEEITSEFVKPPMGLALAALVLASCGLASAGPLRGHFAFIGWSLGFAAVIAGVSYRWVLRKRQVEPLYLPNKVSDRLMLLGVFCGFAGIVLNAVLIAQRTIS